MVFRKCIVLLMACGFSFYASGATISGTVIDSATTLPIANATVSLKGMALTTYTDVQGKFSFIFTPSQTGPAAITPGRPALHFTGGTMFFSTAAGERLIVDLYDIHGRKTSALFNRTFGVGTHSLSLPSLMRKNTGAGLYLIRIRKGADLYTGTLLSMGAKDRISVDGGGEYSVNGFAPVAITASLDSLPVFRMAYVPKTLPIVSYVTQDLGTIALSHTAEEASVAKKVDSLLALMSLAEKAGQMTQVQINSTGNAAGKLTDAQVASLGIGSVFNGSSNDGSAPGNTPAAWAGIIDRVQNVVLASAPHKIPFIYGQDCVHGVGGIAGCTVFPHDIGLGATHDSALVAQIGRITASEAAGCGIRLTFAPCVASVRNEKWGRTYEGFGETPEINTQMGVAFVRGLQGDGDLSRDSAIAASVKHFMGDGGTTNGTNAGIANLADSTMRGVHFPQYVACARENMATIMPSYHTWTRPGGTPSFHMTFDSIAYRMVKKEAGFDGIAVSDWEAVSQDCGSYSNSCVAQAVNAGLDMAMVTGNANPTAWINAIVADVGNGTIPQSRVDDAVRRILRIKFRMHLFDHPLSNATIRGRIYSAAHQAVARQAVRESLVLLKNNNNALPLLRTEKIGVAGAFASDMGAQCGGWTVSWQGQLGAGPGIAGQTILAGMQSVGNAANITYSANGSGLTGMDKIVVVVGESPYAEGSGDNLNNLDLTNTNGAGALITTCFNTGKPVVVVLLSGRPMIIDGEINDCAAFVAAWLPGGQGAGVADVLYANYNFTGTLTHSWPSSYAQIPINTGKNYADEQHGSGGAPLYPYGYGLHY